MKLLCTLLMFLLCTAIVWARDSTLRNDSINTLPDSNTREFRTDSRKFLDHEVALLKGEMLPPFIRSGGLHPTSTSLTTSAFATVAHVPERVSQSATSITYAAIANDVCWTIISSDNNGITGWTRVGSGNTGAYYYQCEGDTTPNQPTLPANSAWLMGPITITGSVIVTVIDKRMSASEALNGIPDIADPLYGTVVGDGIVDDSAGIRAALASGRPFDFRDRTYLLGSRLAFNQSNVQYVGHGAILRFNGANTTRLADITGNNILFDGIIFDGNLRQPKGYLVYLGPNTERVRFHNVIFKRLTGTTYGSDSLNQMYALGISPYGVTNFEIISSRFEDLIKYNDGSLIAAAVGLGFVGGIFFYTEDFTAPTAAQATPSSGVIDNVHFENIQTILANGLTEANRIEFDDGDAIRNLCDIKGAIRLPVKITNTTYHKVSKRAVKVSVCRGTHIENMHIFGVDLPYGMVSAIKLDNETFVKNVRMWASSTKRVITFLQQQGHAHSLVDGAFVDYVSTCLDNANSVVGIAQTNIKYKNIYCSDTLSVGYVVNNTTLPTSQSDMHLEDSYISLTGVTARGIEVATSADNTTGFHLKNVTVYNGDVKVAGNNNHIDGLRLHITSTGYTGGTASRTLLEVGATGLVGPNTVRNTLINADGISTVYTSATRPYLIFLESNQLTIDGLVLRVPEGLSVTYPHLQLGGNDLSVNNLDYFGPGAIRAGDSTTAAIIRGSLKNLTRFGSGAASTNFIYADNALNNSIVLENITDFRPTTAATVRLNGGVTSGYIVRNVSTNSSNSEPAIDGGNLYQGQNLLKIKDPTFANLGAPEDGTIEWCRDCTFANPCASGGSGAWAKRIAGAWRCD